MLRRFHETRIPEHLLILSERVGFAQVRSGPQEASGPDI
jgi:hypothetical protein